MKRPDRTFNLSDLRVTLDRCVTWPTLYTFKFIVPEAQLNHLLALIDGMPYRTRESSQGNYIGVTVEASMESSEAVVAVYQRVSTVTGLMAF